VEAVGVGVLHARIHWKHKMDKSIILTKGPQHLRNGRKILQMVINYTNIFKLKAFQNLPKLGFFWHLATPLCGIKLQNSLKCRKAN
jgi:hypothetical protein